MLHNGTDDSGRTVIEIDLQDATVEEAEAFAVALLDLVAKARASAVVDAGPSDKVDR